ncbi:hypothetical protein J437_LFUL008358 [Ladona fulva]|uniref:Transcriptional coactivator p15 (PC4) C-terminal domain-containing protein n=1 Tax=Ladona fulva TaxID=123851 RepID=A0A8K0P0F1_LADFU|nr:hypothetical protein J437_LFUL008358 [Ladona fulva]
MPKNKDKKKVSDSDSSETSEEEKPPPTKKSKSATTSAEKDENGDYSWQLEKMRYVKVREFHGKVYVDIREYYNANGDMKPGKKGISLSATQWRKLKDLMPEIDQALSEK